MADPARGTPEPADPYIDYAKAPTPMAELSQAVLTGDVVGAYNLAREETLFERGDPVVFVLALTMLIVAISKLIERTGQAGKPVIEAVAENMKRPKDRL